MKSHSGPFGKIDDQTRFLIVEKLIFQFDPERNNNIQRWEECPGISEGRERSLDSCSYQPQNRNIQLRFSCWEMF